VIIFGIDPGTQKTGYGIVSCEGSALRHVDCGIIAPPAKLVLSDKVKFIHDGLIALLHEHRPDAIAIEEIFVAKNSRSALVLGHARGVALLAAATLRIPIHGYAATAVKKGITGSGAATKPQVQEMVKTLLGLPEIAQEDAADALALAITHAFNGGAART
jgi:crossover junction endodeoxyribonuclease RuvC